jgi:hypothetical protein
MHRRPNYSLIVVNDLLENLEMYEMHRIDVIFFINRMQDVIEKVQTFIIKRMIYYCYSELETKTLLFSALHRLVLLLNKQIYAKNGFIVYNIQLDNYIKHFKDCIVSLNNRFRLHRISSSVYSAPDVKNTFYNN